MTPEEQKGHLLRIAHSYCKTRHPDYYKSLICSGQGEGPPCSDCRAEVRRDYELKQAKFRGRVLSPEEARAVRNSHRLP